MNLEIRVQVRQISPPECSGQPQVLSSGVARSSLHFILILTFKKDTYFLFIFRERGWEGEREGEKH